MKILLLSDTHSHLDDAVLRHVKWADEVWHAGDIGKIEVADAIKKIKPLRAVYGNIDSSDVRSEFPLDHRFSIAGLEVLMTHIGGYPGRYNKRIKEVIIKKPPKLFISGHSHILKVQYDHKLALLHMNPGAAGIYGFHTVRTMLRFEIHNGEIAHLEIIELGKKS